jgi:hypothetical protein
MLHALCVYVVGGSFNGRTPDSDSANRGSTPRPPANLFNNLDSFLRCTNLTQNVRSFRFTSIGYWLFSI